MSTFVLIPGAGGAGRVYWSEVAAELESRGHSAVSVEIDGSDPSLGLPEYAAITDEAIGDHDDLVVVAQSMGGFTAPMIGKLGRVRRIVFLNAMIPLPGETPGEWFEATHSDEARRAANAAAGRSDEFDLEEVFLHDIPDEVRASMAEGDREPADTPFGQPCTFKAWPDVPLHVLVGADDRLFPADFQVRVAQERLGVVADVMPGGHLVAKSRPVELADRLVGYLDVAFGLDDAAAEVRRVASAVQDDQLDARTPCDEWSVRDLAVHLCGLTVAFRNTALKQPTGGAPDVSGDLPDDWREQLAADLGELVDAWRHPSAWQGMSEAGGVTMPSAQLAVVALDELVLHGWDLARATGQEFHATDRDIELCTGFAAAVSTPEAAGMRAGLFGPLVDTADDAPALERFLGLAGRDVRR